MHGIDRRTASTVEQIGVRPSVRVGAPRVEPVVVGRICKERSAPGELREDDALDRERLVTGHEIERFRLAHVGAGVDVTTRRRTRRRLLDESEHPRLLVRFDHTELRRIVDGREMDRREGTGRASRLMERAQRGEVEFGDDVTVGDEERLVALVQPHLPCGETDRSRGVERSVLDCVVQLHAGALRVGECLQKRLGFEAEGEHRIGDAAARETFHEILEQRAMPDGKQRLGNVVRQRTQTGTETTDEDDGEHRSATRLGLVAGEQRCEIGHCGRNLEFGALGHESDRQRLTVVGESHGRQFGDRHLARVGNVRI